MTKLAVVKWRVVAQTTCSTRADDNAIFIRAMAVLFGRDIKTISKRISNVFSEGELEKATTIAKFATVQKEGDRSLKRNVA